MKRSTQIIALILSLMTFAGCSAGPGTGSFGFIPDLQLDCSSIQAPACAQGARKLYVGVHQQSSLNCEDYLSNMSFSVFETYFDASYEGQTEVQGARMYKLINQWINSQGASTTELTSGTYRVCAFIDSNNNMLLDSQDAVGVGLIVTGETGPVVTDWVQPI